MRLLLMHFFKDESGATSIEYGIIASGIAVAIAATVQATGGQVTALFSGIGNAVR